MKTIRLYISVLFFSIISGLLYANIRPSIFDKLGYEEVVDVSMTLDLDALSADWRNDEKHPATLSYKNAAGELETWNIKVKLRGKFRRMHCNTTPPLKIYFDKEDLKMADLAKHNDFKLVNYCLEDKIVAKELLVKEYLTYKMYNTLTPESFRVQLLKITYKDTKSNRRLKQLGFLIEDTAQLRKRIEANKYDKAQENGGPIPFAIAQMQTMSVFQYMIGNADWHWTMEKNIKFVERNGKVLGIPYDFDFAAVVDAPYAIPNVNYGLTDLSERIYLGIQEDISTIAPVLATFEAKKEAILKLVKDTKLLNSAARKEILEYLESFYVDLSVETLTGSTRIASYVPVELHDD